MKKSTILMLVVIYIVAFFVVGLIGIQLKSHYHVEYLNEIQIEVFDEDQPLKQTNFETRQLNEGQEISEDRRRTENKYEFVTTSYRSDMVLKFKVVLIPENTSVTGFSLYCDENNKDESVRMYTVVKNDDNTVFIKNIKKFPIPGYDTNISFTLEDLQKHNIKTFVNITVK